MPDINFNDTYDELSNLAVDPAEMKKDEEPKKAKELKFIEEVKKAISAEFGDIFTTAKKAREAGLGLIYRYDTKFDKPEGTPTQEDVEDAVYLIKRDLLNEFKNAKDMTYKLCIYYSPAYYEYRAELYTDEVAYRYFSLVDLGLSGVDDLAAEAIKREEEDLAGRQKQLDGLEAKIAREKENLESSIKWHQERIDFIKAHTKGYEAEVEKAPTEA